MAQENIVVDLIDNSLAPADIYVNHAFIDSNSILHLQRENASELTVDFNPLMEFYEDIHVKSGSFSDRTKQLTLKFTNSDISDVTIDLSQLTTDEFGGKNYDPNHVYDIGDLATSPVGNVIYIAIESPQTGAPGTEGSGWVTASSSGDKGDKGDPGIQGPPGPVGPSGSGVYVRGSSTVEDIIQKPHTAGDMWIATGSGTDDIGNPVVAGDGIVSSEPNWIGVGPVRGPEGPMGQQGNDGANGIDGQDGRDGQQGQTGPAGPEGQQGIEGPQGVAGAGVTIQGSDAILSIRGKAQAAGHMWISTDTGVDDLGGAVNPGDGIVSATPNWVTVGPIRGPQGLTGATGADGADGIDGEQGIQGIQGEQGVQGETGAQGTIGPTGDKGDTGDTGLKGDTGDQGVQGIDGVKGDTGADGADGATGAQGIQGEVGSQGVQGDIGATGDTGDTGPQGDQGIQGIQGIQGVEGDTGIQGPIGPEGPLPAEGTYVAQTGVSKSATLPVGTTAQRDVTPTNGMIRYNSEEESFEGYGATAWGSIGGGATGGGSDDAFYENSQHVTQSYELTAGKNAMSAGPITIDDGVVVTIPDGAVWTIV